MHPEALSFWDQLLGSAVGDQLLGGQLLGNLGISCQDQVLGSVVGRSVVGDQLFWDQLWGSRLKAWTKAGADATLRMT